MLLLVLFFLGITSIGTACAGDMSRTAIKARCRNCGKRSIERPEEIPLSFVTMYLNNIIADRRSNKYDLGAADDMRFYTLRERAQMVLGIVKGLEQKHKRTHTLHAVFKWWIDSYQLRSRGLEKSP